MSFGSLSLIGLQVCSSTLKLESLNANLKKLTAFPPLTLSVFTFAVAKARARLLCERHDGDTRSLPLRVALPCGDVGRIDDFGDGV